MDKYWKSNYIPVFSELLKIYGIKIKKKPNITIKEFNENKIDCLAQADPKIITKVTPAPRKIDLRETEFVIISNVFACKLSIDLAIFIFMIIPSF